MEDAYIVFFCREAGAKRRIRHPRGNRVGQPRQRKCRGRKIREPSGCSASLNCRLRGESKVNDTHSTPPNPLQFSGEFSKVVGEFGRQAFLLGFSWSIGRKVWPRINFQKIPGQQLGSPQSCSMQSRCFSPRSALGA